MKKTIAIIIALVMLTTIIQIMPSVKAFSGSGSGIALDPYQITNADQLNETRDDLTANYTLMNDIDLAGCENWNGGEGVIPIGIDFDTPFTGSFDGQNFTISNLFINNDTGYNQGLFGYGGSGGVIKNLGLTNADITGAGNVAGLIGTIYEGTITNCYSTGTVTGLYTIGGLICHNMGGTIFDCYSTVNVTGNSYVGGLVGYDEGTTTNNCYSTGTVAGTHCVGGLVGEVNGGTITNCYSTGIVTGDTKVGGLIGDDFHMWGTVTNCYWDNETSGQPTSDGGTGRTTAQMTYPYEGYDPPCEGLYESWDLANYTGNTTSIWVHDDLTQNNGYPLFREDYIQSLPWDINQDGVTNYLDASALASRYGESGAPGWIPEDINDDGFVNYLDVSILVTHYGESY